MGGGERFRLYVFRFVGGRLDFLALRGVRVVAGPKEIREWSVMFLRGWGFI